VRQEERTPENEVRYGCFTLGTEQGPNGAGVLATVEFEGEGDGQSALELDQVIITDQGNPVTRIPFELENGAVTVEGSGGGFPWLLIAIIGGVAALVVIGAAAGLRVARSRTPSPA
jgi:hypothetical protein